MSDKEPVMWYTQKISRKHIIPILLGKELTFVFYNPKFVRRAWMKK